MHRQALFVDDEWQWVVARSTRYSTYPSPLLAPFSHDTGRIKNSNIPNHKIHLNTQTDHFFFSVYYPRASMETTTYNNTALMESIQTKDVSESSRGSSSKNHLRSSPPDPGVASNAPAAASLGMSVMDGLLESKASCRGTNSPCDERDAESGCKDRARSQSRSFAPTELRDRNEIRLGTTQDDQSSHPSRAHPANKDGRFISKSTVEHKPLSSERRNKVVGHHEFRPAWSQS
jgi:hypothetical protein